MAENLAVEQNPKTAALVALSNGLKEENSGWVTQIVDALDEVTVYVPRENIVDVCWFLKTRHQFDMLADLNGADLGAEEEPRFEVIYHLFSTKTYHRLRLKVLLSDEDTHVPTVTTVWRTANWHERETYDMFGVIFDGHPDLRRILLPSDFDGHALRKDYPLRGFEPYSLS
ncbi:MAG: NADH-quinone oxidoreductase subunit C [Acidobacteriota bacterium]|nr:NADH-quinone oxidoreductase subunit C [Acidobacteriota bacterium]